MRIDCAGFAEMGAPPDVLAQTEPVQRAYRHLVKEGYVVLDRVLPPATLAALDTALMARIETGDDRVELGCRRYALPIELSGRLADPLIYANPAIVAVARVALDRSAILQGFGVEVALPDATAQPAERDGRLLFDADLSPLLPAHALACRLPLEAQTVTLWPGSHRWKANNDEVAAQAVEIPAGSAAIFDFRLLSGTTANRSDRPRHMLHAAYARRWFRDTVSRVWPAVRLKIGGDFLASVAGADRGLFAHLVRAI